MDDIKKDLPMAMTMAAFAGISWFIGAEINITLFLIFKRRSGLYFWSCALGSWGVVLQPLFIILADFGVWKDLTGSITMIYLTWFIMVVPQSWVLYSRLHLVMNDHRILRWVKFVLIFNSIVFSVPTLVMGILAQTTDIYPSLPGVYSIWDRLQTTVFFAQETVLSLLYIQHARQYIRDVPHLHNAVASSRSSSYSSSVSQKKAVLYQLIYTNLLIIALDIALLGIQFANLFYLMGAFKPCVYGLKLKVEFVILNRLVKNVRARRTGTYNSDPTVVRRDGQESPGSPLPATKGFVSFESRLRDAGEGEAEQSQRFELPYLASRPQELRPQRSNDSRLPLWQTGDDILHAVPGGERHVT